MNGHRNCMCVGGEDKIYALVTTFLSSFQVLSSRRQAVVVSKLFPTPY